MISLETSKCIPVLAYDGIEENDANIIMDGDSNPKSPPEYVMIELNGELIAPVEYPSPDTCRTILGKDSSVELGKLGFDDANKKPTMTVGNHIVTGTVQPLKEPFCLMEKQYADEAGHKVLQSYQIIGVVKQKYLFNSYPKVIMR